MTDCNERKTEKRHECTNTVMKGRQRNAMNAQIRGK